MKRFILLTYCLLLGVSVTIAQNQTNLRTVNSGGNVVTDGNNNTWQYSIGETFVAPIGGNTIMTQGFNQPSTLIDLTQDTTFWNGTVWSNGEPDSSKVAQIDSNYSTKDFGGFVSGQLIVSTGVNFSIDDSLSVIEVKDNVLNQGLISKWCLNNSNLSNTINGDSIQVIQPIIITNDSLVAKIGDTLEINFSVNQMNNPSWLIFGQSIDFTAVDHQVTGVASVVDTSEVIVRASQNACLVQDTFDIIINDVPTGIDTQVACDSFIWIDGNTYTSSNNTARHILVGANSVGGDSLVKLNLTIHPSPQKPTIIGDSIPFCSEDSLVYTVNNIPTGSVISWNYDIAKIGQNNAFQESDGDLVLLSLEKDIVLEASVISDLGCVSLFDSMLIDPQNCPLSADFIIANDTLCLSDSLEVINNSSGESFTLFSWRIIGEDTVSRTTTVESFKHLLTKAGTYDIELIVADSNTTDTLYKQNSVLVLEQLEESSIIGDSAVCFDSGKTYSLGPINVSDYSTVWSTVSGSLNSLSVDSVLYFPFTLADDRVFDDTLKVTVVSGCGESKSYTKPIHHVYEDLSTINGLETCEEEGEIQLPIEFLPYKLSFTNLRNDTILGEVLKDSLEVKFKSQGEYIVKVEDTIPNFTCEGVDTITIALIPGFELVDDQTIIRDSAVIVFELDVLDNDPKFVHPDSLQIISVNSYTSNDNVQLTILNDNQVRYLAPGFVGVDSFYYEVQNKGCPDGIGVEAAKVFVNIPRVEDELFSYTVNSDLEIFLKDSVLLLNDVGGLDTVIYGPLTYELGSVDSLTGEVKYQAVFPDIDTAYYESCIVNRSFENGYDTNSCRPGKAVLVFNRGSVDKDYVLHSQYSKDDLGLRVFNVVTPNGDGVHDFLELELYLKNNPNVLVEFDDDFSSSSKLLVYTKWGDIIYKQEGFKFDEQKENSFAGYNQNGKELPSGTYYYIYELEMSKGINSGVFNTKKHFTSAGFLILKFD